MKWIPDEGFVLEICVGEKGGIRNWIICRIWSDGEGGKMKRGSEINFWGLGGY